jgi:hypothetical protein
MTQTIDLEPQTLDLVLYAGDGAKIRLTVTDQADAPVTLSGTVVAQIRTKRPDADPAKAIFSVDLANAATGVVLLSLTGTQTQALIVGGKKFKGFWDVQWTPSGAQPISLVQGTVECVLDVSR